MDHCAGMTLENSHFNRKARVLFAGDAMLGRGVNEMIDRLGPAHPLAPLAPLTRAADLFLVNLECAISPRVIWYTGPPKGFYFRAGPLAADVLTDAGVDLVSLANNHALDADYEGLRDTLRILDEKGIAHVGAGEDLQGAGRPAFLQSKGLRLAVVAYCDHQSDFAAAGERPGIRYVDTLDPDMPAQLEGEIAALAPQVDHVIVAFHWQPNWSPHVAVYYRLLAQRLVNAGARVIWGHSPHHFQGVEWIGNGAVLYSAGDLVDDYALHPQYRNDRQLLLEVTLSPVGVEKVRAYPIELEYAFTRPAGPDARLWIAERFRAVCAEVGSHVVEEDEWLEVLPKDEKPADA